MPEEPECARWQETRQRWSVLRVQRSRLADRMRPPWWYLTGIATMYALVFAGPFTSRFLPGG